MTRAIASALLALALLPLAPPRDATAARAPVRTAPAADGRDLVTAAREARERGQYARAESLAIAARNAIEPRTRSDSLRLAAAWGEQASAIARQRRYADTLGVACARRSLELWERAGAADSLGAAEAHEVLSEFLSMTRHSAEALEHERAAVPVLRRVHGASEWTALALERTGVLHGQLGQPDSALAAFREALSIYRARPDTPSRKVGDTLVGIGLALEALGEDDAAQDSLDAGISSLEARLGPNDPALAVNLGRVAGFASRHGEIARLVDLMERAHAIRVATRASDDPERLVTAAQLATACFQLGDVLRAVRLFDANLPALAVRMGETNHAVMSFAYDHAAAVAQAGDTLRALAMLRDLERRFRADTLRGDRVLHASGLRLEGELAEARGDPEGALDRYRRSRVALAAADDAGTGARSRVIREEMLLRARRGEWARADSLDRELSAELPELHGLSEESAAYVARSRVHALRAQRDSAFADALVAARIARETLARDAAALSDAQALLLAANRTGDLDPLLALGVRGTADERWTAWDELVRTRGLVRALVARRRRPPVTASPTWAERHAAWVAASRRLARFEVQMAGQRADSAQQATRVARREEVDEAERRLARAAGDGRGGIEPERVTLERVLSALASDAVLVAFSHAVVDDAGPRLVAFVARGGSSHVTSVDLGRSAQVAERVARWREQLSDERPERRSERRARVEGIEVRRAVWDPLAKAVAGARRVVVVEEAPLDGLPWPALPVAGGRFLVETGPEIEVVDAERDLLDRERPSGAGALVVGGVDFEQGAPPREPAIAPRERSTREPGPADCAESLDRLPALPGTLAEARLVASTLEGRARGDATPATLIEAAAATEASFKALAPGKRVLHLATHGVTLSDTCGRGAIGTRGVGGVSPLVPGPRPALPVRARVPAKEAPARRDAAQPSPWAARQELLAFAGANHARIGARDENDGMLTAEEAGTLDLRGVDWVVLSACHSAAGSAWTREGVLGLQRAFHLAGARTVIASQWAVEDLATRDWMRALYSARAAGATDAAGAIAIADREILRMRRRDHLDVHPFYWAAFTATRE